MIRWLQRFQLGRHIGLVDDFPRQLNQFEKRRIQNELINITTGLVVEPVSLVSRPTLSQPHSPSVELILNSLTTWPVELSVKRLRDLPVHADIRVERFLAKCFNDPSWREKFDSETLYGLFELVPVDSPHRSLIAEELVIARPIEDFEKNSQRAAKLAESSERVMTKLIEYAHRVLDVDLLLALAPYSASRLPIPALLVPTLSKSDMITLLDALSDCEFPEVITETLRLVGEELGRLSFRRLVSAEDQEKLLLILFRLKVKLDSMAAVDNNPFYERGKTFFKSQILRGLSTGFDQNASVLAMHEVARTMVALLGINSLNMRGLELVANRINVFASENISVLSPTEFTWLIFAFARHPESWKKRDTWRQQIASPLAKGLLVQSAELSETQKIACISALMTFHNKHVRSAVVQVLETIDFAKVSRTELLEIGRIIPQLKLQGMHAIVTNWSDAVAIDGLRFSQLIELLDVFSHLKLVGRSEEVVRHIESTLESGMHVSPRTVSRILGSIGALQLRKCERIVSALIGSIEESITSLPPHAVSSVLTNLALASIPNPGIVHATQSMVEASLLLLAEPGNLETIDTSGLTSLVLLGPPGKVFLQHVKDLDIAEEDQAGPIPRSSSLIGDILGALVPMEFSATAGFELDSSRCWRRNEDRKQIYIVRSADCARDNPRHILAAVAARIAKDRSDGWDVLVVPEDAVMAVKEGTLKKRVRRAKIIHKNGDTFSQLREVLSSD
jgi:hypothetical protein